MVNIDEIEMDSKFIKRRKAAVKKKYSSTRSRAIEEANELAVYLCALGRNEEVERFLDSYCEKSPFVNPKFERWEAACFAMLLNAHIKKKNGRVKEFERLIEIVGNDFFRPISWLGEDDFDEFMAGIRRGLEGLGECSHHELCQVRAQGYLVLLYTLHICSPKWEKFAKREPEILNEMESELEKLRGLVA